MATFKDLVEPRYLMKTIEENWKADNFLSKTFFDMGEATTSKYIDIIIEKGGRKLAPYCSPRVEGKAVASMARQLSTIQAPYQKFKFTVAPSDVSTSGNVIYENGKSPLSDFNKLVAKETADKLRMLERRIEQQCGEALQTGKLVVSGDGINEEIDFGFDSSQIITLSGTSLWTDTSNSDPIANLRTWQEEREEVDGYSPNVVVMGKNAGKAFTDHPKVVDAFKTAQTRYNLGEIAPKKLDKSVKYVGYLAELNMEIYIYNGTYKDDSGTLQRYLNEDKVILGTDEEYKGNIPFGAIQDLEGLNARKVFVKTDMKFDPSGYEVLFQSAPVAVPTYVGQYVCSKVV